MQIADAVVVMGIAAVVVMGIAAAGNTFTSEGTSGCGCTRGEGGTAESKGDCKSSYGLT